MLDIAAGLKQRGPYLQKRVVLLTPAKLGKLGQQ